MAGKLKWKGRRDFMAHHLFMSKIVSSAYFLIAGVALITIATIVGLLYVLSITADPSTVIPNARPIKNESSPLGLAKASSVLSSSNEPAKINIRTHEASEPESKNDTSTTLTVNGESIDLKAKGATRKQIVKNTAGTTSTVDINIRSSNAGTSDSISDISIESHSESISESGG